MMSESNAEESPLLNPVVLLLLILTSTVLFACSGAIEVQSAIVLIGAECCFLVLAMIANLIPEAELI